MSDESIAKVRLTRDGEDVSDEYVTGAATSLVAPGGFLHPAQIAEAFGVPLETLYHCELCARYPVRMLWGGEELVYVVWEREPSRFWRAIDRLFGFPTEFHRVEFYKPMMLLESLPDFSAARGGITFS